MEKKVKRLLLGSGMLTAGICATSAAATKLMVDMALNRAEPRLSTLIAKHQLQGFAGDGLFLQKLELAGQLLKDSPHQTVQITAKDGQHLVGHWFPCKNAKRMVVAMHGWRSGWSRDFGMISAFLREHQCNVLYAEQRGQGLSGGDYMGFGMTERHDCVQWVQWVNTQASLPVYLAGVSMGASTVLMAAGLALPSNVRGIIADCGFTSAHQIWRHVAKNNLHISYGVRSVMADALCKKRIQMGVKSCSTVQALANNRIPVLFIHGAQDHFVPVEMTYQNYEACGGPKRLLIVPGADHGMSYYLEKERYEQMLLDFFRDYDQKKAAQS